MTVASLLDDTPASTPKVSGRLGRARVSRTQDRYLGLRLTDRGTADALERIIYGPGAMCPKSVATQQGPGVPGP